MVRISSDGRVTIPPEVRQKAGLLPNTEVEFIIEDDGVRIVRQRESTDPTRGEMVVERLRRNGGHISMTTDEIMALTRGES